MDTFESKLSYRFKNAALLDEALTHTSLGRNLSYERLEFLGDRVLGLVIADILLHRYPDEAEGHLARRHVALVRREALSEVAEILNLGNYARVANSELEKGICTNQAILADICEALIGALYLDGGLEAAENFIQIYWTGLVDKISSPPQDAKTQLQEWAQGNGYPLPDYRETNRQGPPHNPVFTVEVSLSDGRFAAGEGTSKRAAEKAAATELLKQIAQ